ncbi:anti-sigma factor domain-containing protein [Bacillus sp. V59.32b]|uniref:anti-sigma factor domain-containing protein n=1 Tax=Bacillus sp. V59.32b TaxID=1758642 RepID=UPI000E3C1ED2|nr:anti-sigma factor domain-containing protein [Bacillus sp. V59.32b]RFU60041.1 hypothetical protein D0463_18995 [Bacillus sp. V59.32b]
MKKGIILEMDQKYITLMTPEGKFLKAEKEKRPYEIGEEILFTPFHPRKYSISNFFHFSIKKTSIISAAAAVALTLSILPGMLDKKVSAYMTIDINPSIELGLDDQLNVIEMKGLNAEGKDVVKQLSDWNNKSVNTVTDEIVKMTKKIGYFKNQKQIVVSTTVMDKNKKLDEDLKQEMLKTAAIVPKTKVKVLNATEKDRENAKQEGVSTGKYIEEKQAVQEKKETENTQQKQEEPSKKTDEKKEEKQKTEAKAKPEEHVQRKVDLPRRIEPERSKQPKNEKPRFSRIKPTEKPVTPSFKKNEQKHRDQNDFRNKGNQVEKNRGKDHFKLKHYVPEKPVKPKKSSNKERGYSGQKKHLDDRRDHWDKKYRTHDR